LSRGGISLSRVILLETGLPFTRFYKFRRRGIADANQRDLSGPPK
jgi:hypothetical protein